MVENRRERRPGIELFVNGLPLAVIEMKNPADENATIRSAFQQLQTYMAEIPSLFVFNNDLRILTQTPGYSWSLNCRRTRSGG